MLQIRASVSVSLPTSQRFNVYQDVIACEAHTKSRLMRSDLKARVRSQANCI